MNDDLKEAAYAHINLKDHLLRQVGLVLWKQPELGLEEKFAHQFLTDLLETEGFTVTRNYILETGFKAEFATAKKPHIAFFCEYDALPNIGHACGHNLIAEASIGACLGIKNVMKQFDLKCKLTIFGSPGEENAGGKITMINSKALKEVDVAMMVHPQEVNSLHMPHWALQDLTYIFKGCSAHATASPWEGQNALDAAVLAYQGVACFRKQMQQFCTINVNIEMGSDNHIGVICDRAVMTADIRASTMSQLRKLETRMAQIAKGAAMMADCQVEIETYEDVYANLVSNKPFLKAFKSNADYFNIKYVDVTRTGGSTDMGNVSQIVPSIHPVYFIGSEKGPHTVEFAKCTGTECSHNATVIQSKIMAATAIDIATNEELLEEIRKDFQWSKENNFGDMSYTELYSN